MTTQTVLYIIIAIIISILLAVFMYGYKTKFSKSTKWIYGSLRFVTIFSVLLLLINPVFRTETFSLIKPKLPILIDNSESISELNQTVNVSDFIKSLKSNKDLNKKFELSFYTFGNEFKINDSLTFNEKNTNISEALTLTNQLFKDEVAPTILITDGNQTLGNNYEFSSINFKNNIYPLVIGDSTKYLDLKIEQLNTNRYAFLKNNFPVEIILVYQGSKNITSQFEVKKGTTTVYKETIEFTKNDKTKILKFTLPASSVGFEKYTAQINPITEEKNTINNSKQFVVEVIDQSTNVLIVSDIVHPDIGAIKRAIESNEQRKVTIKKPFEALSIVNDHQLIILYQPNRSFTNIYSEINKLNKNTLVFTGQQTDWYFLNNIQDNYIKEVTNQSENVVGILNKNYGAFVINDIDFSDYRPLKTLFGPLDIVVPYDNLLGQSIDGFETETSLLATTELNGSRNAIFDGEGIWKWRAQSFIESKNYNEFDIFFGKVIQYLASNKRRSRLEVSYENFYYNNKSIQISAQYFDKNFVFNSNANLSILITNSDSKQSFEYPLLLNENYYEIDLSNLKAGEYVFKVSVNDEIILTKNGAFTILDFNVEQQFLNPDVTKLSRVATNTKGKYFFISDSFLLIDTLIKDDRFMQVEISKEKIEPLIEWRYLLGLIILSLSIEWFLRKYNGLI
ncbi:MAG: VWA domain-containing protein [Flavobacteriaceae bacterium]|nr:VWA domain-containing protein [Flavobacteriaceae bacterium]